MTAQKMTRFIALISGKGGVGKTTTTINLGHALSQRAKLILLDGNLCNPNFSVHLGMISPENTLNDFLERKKNIPEVTAIHKCGLVFIPTSLDYHDSRKEYRLSEIFEHLDRIADIVLVDCPPGMGKDLSQVLANTDESIVVVNPSLPSVIDALKVIELAKEHKNEILGFVLNKTEKGKDGLGVAEIKSTLEISLLANIPFDKKIKKALYKKHPSHYLYPRAKSSKSFRELAGKI